MPDNTPTDEEKKLFKLTLIRLELYSILFCLLFLALPIGLMFLFDPPSILSVNVAVVVGTVIVTIISYFYALKRVARRLSLKERQALTHIVETSKSTEKTRAARKLLKIATALNPSNKLLRPSAKTEDDTLLRATTHTDDIPQEQLLRPSQDTK